MMRRFLDWLRQLWANFSVDMHAEDIRNLERARDAVIEAIRRDKEAHID